MLLLIFLFQLTVLSNAGVFPLDDNFCLLLTVNSRPPSLVSLKFLTKGAAIWGANSHRMRPNCGRMDTCWQLCLHCRTEQAHENYIFKVIILQVNGESKKNNRKAESRLGISLQIIKLLR